MRLNGKYNVAEVLFNKFFFISFLLIIQVESFFYIYYNYLIFSIKVLKLNSLNNTTQNILVKNINKVYFLLTIICLLCYKGDYSGLGLLTCVIVLFMNILNNLLELIFKQHKVSNYIYLIIPSFSIFIFMSFLINSFLVLFFFIEIYSVLYYFCFLINYNFTNQTILKYKNGLLLLLWNNFLTSVFLIFSCFLFLKFNGTTCFIDLNYVSFSALPVYLYLIGLF